MLTAPTDAILYRDTIPQVVETPLSRWEGVKQEIKDLIQYRLNGCQDVEYRESQLRVLRSVDELKLEVPSSIDRVPEGILAEVFFMRACREVGLECKPSSASEDRRGVDFELSDSLGTIKVDVTKNRSYKNIRNKIHYGKNPSLFLPWGISSYGPVVFKSNYANEYIMKGKFDGAQFLREVIRFNEQLLEALLQRYDRGTDMPVIVGGNQYPTLPWVSREYITKYRDALVFLNRTLTSNTTPAYPFAI